MAQDLELLGRTAKAHIDKWEQYGEKAKQHATSAAIILVQVQEDLKSRVKYGLWLRKHDIAGRTASRLVLEHLHPEKREERQENDRAAKAADRAVLREAKRNRPDSGRETADKPLEKQETAPQAGSSALEAAKQAVQALSISEFTEFKQWFRDYCGA